VIRAGKWSTRRWTMLLVETDTVSAADTNMITKAKTGTATKTWTETRTETGMETDTERVTETETETQRPRSRLLRGKAWSRNGFTILHSPCGPDPDHRQSDMSNERF